MARSVMIEKTALGIVVISTVSALLFALLARISNIPPLFVLSIPENRIENPFVIELFGDYIPSEQRWVCNVTPIVVFVIGLLVGSFIWACIAHTNYEIESDAPYSLRLKPADEVAVHETVTTDDGDEKEKEE